MDEELMIEIRDLLRELIDSLNSHFETPSYAECLGREVASMLRRMDDWDRNNFYR